MSAAPIWLPPARCYVTGGCRGGEASLDERRPQPRELHDLLTAAVSRNDREGGAREGERLGEQAEDLQPFSVDNYVKAVFGLDPA